MDITEKKIEWAKRVPMHLIRKLYELDAKNIQDNELMDEIGYGLYARAIDFVRINRAHDTNTIDCHSCGREIRIDSHGLYHCTCGWGISKEDYHATYKRKQYVGTSIVPYVKQFMSDWEKARDSYPKKMLSIDCLIHRFHWESREYRVGRPAAINFIEGRLDDIVDFMLELAYSNDKEIYLEQRARWFEKASQTWMAESILEKKEGMEKQRRMMGEGKEDAHPQGK